MLNKLIVGCNVQNTKPCAHQKQCPECNAQNAMLRMQCPDCHAQNSMPSMPCPACHAQHALPSMPCPTCTAQHAMSSMPCPAFNAQNSTHNIQFPACKSTKCPYRPTSTNVAFLGQYQLPSLSFKSENLYITEVQDMMTQRSLWH
jgi:hypothetical protein